jgi:hypothetical protein
LFRSSTPLRAFILGISASATNHQARSSQEISISEPRGWP